MIKKIYLAGGCFWGIEEYYSRLEGVANTLAAMPTVQPQILFTKRFAQELQTLQKP